MLHVLIYKTETVPVILCGCEIWCLTSREEHRLTVFESRVWGEFLMLEWVRSRGMQKNLYWASCLLLITRYY